MRKLPQRSSHDAVITIFILAQKGKMAFKTPFVPRELIPNRPVPIFERQPPEKKWIISKLIRVSKQFSVTKIIRGVLNFSAKSIRRRICHVKAYAWNVNFSAFAIEELFRIKACQWRQNALKFKFRCTKIFGQNKFKLVITCQNVNFSVSKLKF